MAAVWRWYFLALLFQLRVPQSAVDFKPFEERSELPCPVFGPQNISGPNSQLLEFENVLRLTNAWTGRETDSVNVQTRRFSGLIQTGRQPVATKQADVCQEADVQHRLPICLEANHPSTLSMDSANASLNHGDKSKDDTSFTSKMHLGSILLLAKQLWGEYSEMLVISLLDEWQPGTVFDSKDMVIPTSFKVLMILAFIWRTMCAVTSRKHLLTEKQLAKQISQLIDEKCEALKKLSDLNKKIKEHEKQFKESQELVTSTLCENKDLRECLKQLQRRCKQLTEEKDSLDTTLMMQIKKNQIKTIKQAPEITKQTNQQNERAIQQKLSQEELEWRAQIAKVLEEINGYEQSIKEIKNEQQKTEQQFKNQMKKCEEQYIESRKLVDTLKQLNEERKRHEKEEIAQKVKAFMEEVWLKEVIEGEGWLNNNEKSNQTVKEQKQTLSTSPDLGCISGYQAQD